MHVFVDFVGPSGDYRASPGPSWIDPALPTAVLKAGAFLDAAGEPGAASSCRLYHVERGELLTASRFADAGVGEMDTVVVVNCDDPRLGDPDTLDALWREGGGPTRRLTHSGMPEAERAALHAYAN